MGFLWCLVHNLDSGQWCTGCFRWNIPILFDITFFWKMILNFRLLENNELICPFYAYFLNFFFFLKIFSLGKRFSPGLGFEPALYEQKVRAMPLGYEGQSRPEILNDWLSFQFFFIETFKMSNLIEIWKKSDKIITNSFISLTITTIRHYFK